jgi:hypothetical protein
MINARDINRIGSVVSQFTRPVSWRIGIARLILKCRIHYLRWVQFAACMDTMLDTNESTSEVQCTWLDDLLDFDIVPVRL